MIAAIAGLFGTAGLHNIHALKTGWWEILDSACALVGQARFFADGVIAYAVFPPFAKSIPAALDLDGFMFMTVHWSQLLRFHGFCSPSY